ncbi:MAG: hypothetical protein ABSH10_04225 [Phycisphaerae bacterium]
MNLLQSTTTTAGQPSPSSTGKSFLERHAALLAVGIVLLAAALRLGVAPILTLDGDECHTILVGRSSFADLVHGRAFDIGNPQGFHMFLSALRQVFGENILLYRSANAIIGTLAVAVIMMLCRLLSPRPAIWLGVGLLTALNPMELTFSLHLRPWAVQALTLSLAMWAALRWQRDRRPWMLVVYVLSMFAAVNTNYSAVFCWAALGLWWLWDSRRSGRQVAAVVAVNVLVLVLFAPSMALMWWQIHHQELTRGGGAWMFHLFGFPYFFIYGNSVARPERGLRLILLTAVPALIVLAPLLLAGLRAVWKTVKPRGVVLAMLFLPFLFMAGFCLYQPFFFSRYLAFMWPMFALTLMLGLYSFGPRIRAAAFVLLLAMELLGCAGYAARFAEDYPAFLYPTLQAYGGPHYGIVLYPTGERQIILQSSSQPTVVRIMQTKPDVVVAIYPNPPTDYVKTYPTPRQKLSTMLAGGLPDELWFYCDLRPTGEYRDAPAVLEQVKQLLAGPYRLEQTWQWPSQGKGQVLLLKYRRAEVPASKPGD